MDALIPVLALVALGLLAMRFGADSRPALRSDEHRLAAAGMVWDAPSKAPEPVADTPGKAVAADDPAVRHVVWAPMLAAHSGMASSPFPTLRALDRARAPGQPPFATDPNAERLEQRARRLIDRHWSERVWLTGFVDRSRFDLVCDTLERERQDRRQCVDVIVVSEHPSSITS
ncbi:MAG: hypothetical protein M3457_07150 [Chloroflexota bacterium]|nr:hypothetical protein [Chloroflexota bacterium]